MPQHLPFQSATFGASGRPKGNAGRAAFAPATRARAHWIACIALSIALHLALVFGTRVTAIRPAGAVVQGQTIAVYLPGVQTAAETVGADPRSEHKSFVVERSAAESAAVEPRLQQPAQPPKPAQLEARRAEPPPLPAALLLPPGFDEAEYTPSARLSVRPSAVDEIAVPYPEGVDHRGVSKAILMLFIDEEGTVVRVKIDKSDLPSQFQEAATNSFAQARFHPGRIDDRPVKSRMRIEVTFDSDAASRGTAAYPPR